MADKRISQLVERINIANNDVLPIVASGATTTNKVTVSTLQDWMQDNLDVGVTSVGLSMPSAFTVTNSPVTTSGNISVVGAGTVSQYIRGDGSLADFPQGGGGGGSSVNYYLNGSVSQGTIGGVAYLEMNKTPILGAGTDFTINADGYIASFITDAGDPALLEIPAGNWNFETYLQASSAGGTPSFYIELYKVNSGGTATLIASNSGTPELIAFGTSTTPYFSALAVPTTTLALTDRLALRYYVTHSGRTITLHTENNTLCQIITTFTTGLTALNGLTAQVQNFATGTSGTDFNISSSTSTHTFNLPTASSSNRGALSSADWTTFNGKQNALNGTGFVKISGTTISYDNSTYLTTGSAASTYVPYTGAAANVDLGVYNITSSAVNVNGSGSNAGVINLESNTIFPLVNGYGTIGSGTTNQFNFYQTTGAGVFRGAILSLNSIADSVTRTYTLPNADGTLSLTSDLSAYLPLTGGTISGTLNVGSGSIRIAAEGASNITILRNFTGTAQGQSGFNHIGFNNSNNLYFTKNLNNGCIFSFNNSAYRTYTFPDADATIASTSNLSAYLPLAGGTLTGALNGTSASFSGLITSTVGNGGTLLKSTNATTSFQIGVDLRNTGGLAQFCVESSVGGTLVNGSTPYASIFGSGNSTAAEIQTNGTVRLSIASTGAATFSSSVGIGVSPTAGKLHILAPSSVSYAPVIAIRDEGNPTFGFTFKLDTAVNGDLRLDAVNSGLDSPLMTFKRVTGNVGIGTASSGALLRRLNIVPATDVPQLYLVQSNNDAGGWMLKAAVDGHFRLISYQGSESPKLTVRYDTGNVGIGTDSPNDLMEIKSSTANQANYRLYNTFNDGANNFGINWFRNYDSATNSQGAFINYVRTGGSSGDLAFGTGTVGAISERMRITSGGVVQVQSGGVETQYGGGYKFWNDAQSRWWLMNTYSAASNQLRFNYFGNDVGSINPSSGAYTALSDINKKKDFEESTIGLDAILGLKPTLYRMKDDESEGNKELGFIAQEVKEFIPQAYVENGEEDAKFIGLNYNAIVATLVKAIQEQQEQINSLKNQIK
jgi:hypothetical protein